METVKNRPGIYLLSCKNNGRVYIGASLHLRSRLNNHNYHLRNNNHPNEHIKADALKFGSHSFEVKVLFYCSAKELDYYECLMIEHFKSSTVQGGYNIWSGGRKGRTPPIATRDKIRNTLKGIPPPELALINSYKAICKKVINVETNVVYESVTKAAKELNINESTLRNWLQKRNQPKIDIRFYHNEIEQIGNRA